MTRVMMLVSAQGVALAETRVEEGEAARATADGLLRDEALTSGFTEEEIRDARPVLVGDAPAQP